MNNWRYKLAALMRGRYGPDPLYKALIVLYLVLIVLNMFLRSPVVMYLALVPLVFGFYRVFSKQLAKRAAENRKYLALRDGVRKKVMQTINRFKERNTHRYRACPNCHTTLRLQKKIGTMTVNCPKCHTTFQVTVKR